MHCLLKPTISAVCPKHQKNNNTPKHNTLHWDRNSFCSKEMTITRRPRHLMRRKAHRSKALVKAHLSRQVPGLETCLKNYFFRKFACDLGFAAMKTSKFLPGNTQQVNNSLKTLSKSTIPKKNQLLLKELFKKQLSKATFL